MKKFKGMLKFFLLWLLFLIILPFGLVVFGMVLFLFAPSMLLPDKKRNIVEEQLSCALFSIMEAACNYGDMMEDVLKY